MQSQQKQYSQRTDLSEVEQELCLTVLYSKLVAHDTQVDEHIVEYIILSFIDEWHNNKDKSFNDLIEDFDYEHMKVYAKWYFSLTDGAKIDDQAGVQVEKIETILVKCKKATDEQYHNHIDIIYKLTSTLKSSTAVGNHKGFAEQIGQYLLSIWTTNDNIAKPLSTIIEEVDLTATVKSQYMKVKIKGLPDGEQNIQLNEEEISNIAEINTSIKERLMQTNQHIKQIDELTSELKSTKAGEHEGFAEKIGLDLLSSWTTNDNMAKPLCTIIENCDFTDTITAQYIQKKGESISKDDYERIAIASRNMKDNIKQLHREMIESEKQQKNQPNEEGNENLQNAANTDKQDNTSLDSISRMLFGMTATKNTRSVTPAGGAPATPKSSH